MSDVMKLNYYYKMFQLLDTLHEADITDCRLNPNNIGVKRKESSNNTPSEEFDLKIIDIRGCKHYNEEKKQLKIINDELEKFKKQVYEDELKRKKQNAGANNFKLISEQLEIDHKNDKMIEDKSDYFNYRDQNLTFKIRFNIKKDVYSMAVIGVILEAGKMGEENTISKDPCSNKPSPKSLVDNLGIKPRKHMVKSRYFGHEEDMKFKLILEAKHDLLKQATDCENPTLLFANNYRDNFLILHDLLVFILEPNTKEKVSIDKLENFLKDYIDEKNGDKIYAYKNAIDKPKYLEQELFHDKHKKGNII